MTRSNSPCNRLTFAVFLAFLLCSASAALGQEPCELLINRTSSNALTVFLLTQDGKYFQPLDVPSGPLQDLPSSTEAEVERILDSSHRECTAYLLEHPLADTKDHGKAKQVLSYFQRIDSDDSYLVVGKNQRLGPEAGPSTIQNIAKEWYPENPVAEGGGLSRVSEFNNIDSIETPNTDYIFHPQESEFIGIIRLVAEETVAFSAGDGRRLRAFDLVAALAPPPGTIQFQLTAQVRQITDESQEGFFRWLPKINAGSYFQRFSLVLLGLTIALALMFVVGLRKDYAFVRSLNTRARIKEIQTGKGVSSQDTKAPGAARALLPECSLAEESSGSYDDALLFVENLRDTLFRIVSLGESALQGARLEGQNDAAAEFRDLSALESRMKGTINALGQQSQQAKIEAWKAIYQTQDFFKQAEEPASPDQTKAQTAGKPMPLPTSVAGFAKEFSRLNQRYTDLLDSEAALDTKLSDLNEARAKVNERNTLLKSIDERIVEEAIEGGGPKFIDEENQEDFFQEITVASNDPRTGGTELDLEKILERHRAFLEWLQEKRRGIANVMQMPSTNTWDTILRQTKDQAEISRKEQILKADIAKSLDGLAKSTHACLKIEDKKPRLQPTSTKPARTPELEELQASLKDLELDLGTLHQSLERSQETRRLRRVLELGLVASTNLQSAVSLAENTGKMNVSYEVLEQGQGELNRYLLNLRKRVENESSKISVEDALDLMFTSEGGGEPIIVPLRMLASIKVLQAYGDLLPTRPPEAAERLEAARDAIGGMLRQLGIHVHDFGALMRFHSVKDHREKIDAHGTPRIMHDKQYQAAILQLVNDGTVTAENLVLDIEQMGFEVTEEAASFKPWKTRVYLANEKSLQQSGYRRQGTLG